MGLSADLNIASNWTLAYQDYKEAELVDGEYKPLPAIEVPVIFSSRILIAKTTSNIPSGKKWKWAGYLRAFQQFPNAGINGQITEIAAFSLRLNRSRLLFLPEVATQYELVLSDAFWLRNLQLNIYEFTGDFADSSDFLLNNIQSQLTNVESKIDISQSSIQTIIDSI